jgi:hypothetical protein
MSKTWAGWLGAAIACMVLMGVGGTAWAQEAGGGATVPPAPPVPAGEAAAPAPPAGEPAATATTTETKTTTTTEAAPAAPERDVVDQIKNPVPWFSWGFDERIRQEYYNNVFRLDNKGPNREWNFGRYRSRLWATLSPMKELDLNVRLAWESRYWWEPEIPPKDGWQENNLYFDNINFKVKQPFGLPVTLTVGRQDIILGDGWLVLDGTPYDGSTSIFFDAIRATVDLKDIQTTVDLIYIQNYWNSNKYWPPTDIPNVVAEQNEKGVILWVANKSIKDTEIDGYFIYKHNDNMFNPNSKWNNQAPLAAGDDGDIYTFGSRLVHNFGEHWLAKAEGALQFGNQKTNYPAFSPGFHQQQEIWAGGATTSLTYLFKDKMNNQLSTGYEFLSGDRAGTKGTNEAFNSLWGRWPQWSELVVYNWATEGRIAQITNLHRIWWGWQVDPMKQLRLQIRYHLLFSDRNTFQETAPAAFGDGCFRGQAVVTMLTYKINRFLSGHLTAEWFNPSDYYSQPRDDCAFFTRAELMFTF